MKYEAVDNQPLQLNLELDQVESYIEDLELQYSGIKPDNQARVLWADSLARTEYALVYLHGFEASWAESDPIIQNFQDRYGCNVILSRISQQGLSDVEALLHESPKAMVESAKKFVALGKAVGEKLIILSCSTGSTYSAYLAAGDPDIHAQIMTSPNFDLDDKNSKFITGPWGKQMLKYLVGGDYRSWTAPERAKPYWNEKYRIEGLIALRSLLDQTMTTEIWKENSTPYFIGYYYKDAENYDKVISIEAIHDFGKTSPVTQDRKKVIAFNDALGHVISSKHMNPKYVRVQDSIFQFVETTLGMRPTNGIKAQ